MSNTASLPQPNFVLELFERAQPRRALSRAGWGLAIAAHALAAGFAWKEVRPVKAAPPPLEIELAPPAPPPLPIVPPPPREPEPEPERAVARAAAAAPPQPARAGALLTAKEDAPPTKGADEPVDFTNDPNAAGFGAGVVAVGGTAKFGLAGARPSTAPAGTGSSPLGRAPQGDGLTPVSDLSRKPSLGESDPCRGYFPSAASDDVASASVLVTIGKNGAVSRVSLLSETPPKQGFGAAARTCMNNKRFTPGLDRDGNPAATAIRVNIRFAR
jgi:hypothetical protein